MLFSILNYPGTFSGREHGGWRHEPVASKKFPAGRRLKIHLSLLLADQRTGVRDTPLHEFGLDLELLMGAQVDDRLKW